MDVVNRVGGRRFFIGAATMGVVLTLSSLSLVSAREINSTDGAKPRVPTSKRLFREVHPGWRGNRVTGKHNRCDDATIKKPTMLKMTAAIAADGKSETMNPSLQEVKDLFDAAYAECFMDGADDKPDDMGNVKFETQHDQKHFQVGADDIKLLLRPAANVALGNPVSQDGYGLIVAEVFDTSAKDFTDPGVIVGTIKKKHAALLWMGRDKDGRNYAALIDLAGFPSYKPNPKQKDFSVMDSGPLDPPQKYPYKTDVAFARWDHTHASPGARILIHEGSWVDCDPGCCSASAIQIFAPPSLQTNARRAPNVAKPAGKSALPPPKP
jgi:hypothetical protein